jgi:hypothetical protein
VFLRGAFARLSKERSPSLIVAGLLVVATFPSPAAEIRGTVRDSQGFVVVGARVVVRPEPDRLAVSRTAASNSEGQFRFEDLSSGSYEVETYSPGFQVQKTTLNLADSAIDLQVELTPAGLHEGIVVTASRQETETARLPLPTSLLSDERLPSFP